MRDSVRNVDKYYAGIRKNSTPMFKFETRASLQTRSLGNAMELPGYPGKLTRYPTSIY